MIIEQIYTGCLSQAAYYIESQGEALIIDPLRDTKPYLDRASQSNAQIKYILETHFHADFVSGHQALAEQSGAKIVYGPTAQAGFDFHEAQDGELISLGDITIKVIHTPGHTMESTCFLLQDAEGKDHALFTGDTLFLGDVGRPDLAVKSDLTQEELAQKLYHSLYTKIMPLSDDLILYPGHGAGSACGKKMSKETVGTLGDQKATNYALQNLDEAEFVKQVVTGLATPPQYFPKNAVLNKMGVDAFSEVLNQSGVELSPEHFEIIANEKAALVIDTRPGAEFAQGHIPKSINIGLGGQFASWVGTLIEDLKQPLLLVCTPGQEEEAITRLARVGYDNTLGYLKGGFTSWTEANKESDSFEQIDAEQLLDIEKPLVLDVRNENEYISHHLNLEGLEHIPLDKLNSQVDQLSTAKPLYVHCAGGYRSLIAVSLLKARGVHNVVDIRGGFGALKETQLPMSDYVCPSSLL